MKTVVYGLIVSFFALSAFTLTRQPVIVQSTSPNLPTAAPAVVAGLPTNAPQVIEPSTTKAATAVVTAVAMPATSGLFDLENKRQTTDIELVGDPLERLEDSPPLLIAERYYSVDNYSDDHLEDFESRTPNLDLAHFKTNQDYRNRQGGLFWQDNFFRRFFAPALHELPFIEELLLNGTMDASWLRQDLKLANKTGEFTPFIGFVCSKIHCLMAWTEAFPSSDWPAETLCHYINQTHGKNCEKLVLNDWQVTAKEYSEINAYCRIGYPYGNGLPYLPCFYVVLAPSRAVLFEHGIVDPQLTLQAYHNNQYLTGAELQEWEISDTASVIKNYTQLFPDRDIQATHDCFEQYCYRSVTNYALDFKAFAYQRLALVIEQKPYMFLNSPSDCHDITTYEEPPTPKWITGEYHCYWPTYITTNNSLSHFQKVWDEMNGVVN